jgi:DDE superfamily endonuclease
MAIVCYEEMQIKWPSTAEEITKGIAGFSSISFEQAICNCVGVLDGFLVRIKKVPAKKEAANDRVFFSGHYQCYGVNCQAATDHLSRFIYFALPAPGVSKDRDAVKHCGLKDLIEKLSKGICVIADAAYEPTEHMVPVYQGVDKLKPRYDNFNFYASQVRIRVKMAFRMMTNKWGILQRAIGVEH